ncbi:MAG UNVERIFIED_CONTAM: hypothetical protein LVQ98_06235 [Rickettsiaceae bacterium]|jgi:hypothetical protein
MVTKTLKDPYDLVRQAIHHYTKTKCTSSQDLSMSFRVSQIVKEFAQFVIDMKHKVVGGNVNKDSKVTIDTEVSDNNAILSFISETDNPKTLQSLKDNIAINNLDTIVIIFSENDREEAERVFGTEKVKPIIMHARDTLGLEWNNVILFQPFGRNSPLYSHEKLIKDRFNAGDKTPTAQPKDAEGIGAIIPFNELYVAITRALGSVYVFSHPHDDFAHTFKRASAHILKKCEGGDVIKAEEQTFEELMEVIMKSASLLQDELLNQLVTQALDKMYKAKDQSRSTTKSYLEQLNALNINKLNKQSIQEKLKPIL